MWASCSAARALPTREIWINAGVAQSVAQLSCKQQARGSSPLASSQFPKESSRSWRSVTA
jgi:hypothetical protein